MNDVFTNYHPVINFIYFVLVIGFSMIINHPLGQCIGLAGAVAYAVYSEGRKKVVFVLKYCIPMVFFTTLINPAFNHEGLTILCYLPTGNPLTMESILYGFSAGTMMITVLLWFSSFNRVMTSDKFIYLFGRVIPALSLVLSMALRFVPKFKSQLETVSEAQRSIGRDVSSGSLLSRTKTAILIFSIMITWALENAIESADSMKSRGYGLKNRTAFSIYRMDERDKICAVWLSFCGLFLLAGVLVSAFGFRYFPGIRYMAVDRTTLPFYMVYLALCVTPVLLNVKEEQSWKTLYSRM